MFPQNNYQSAKNKKVIKEVNALSLKEVEITLMNLYQMNIRIRMTILFCQAQKCKSNELNYNQNVNNCNQSKERHLNRHTYLNNS